MKTRLALGAALALTACTEKKPDAPAPVAPPAPAPVVDAGPPPFDAARLKRDDFNFRAQERFLPLFWRSDANGNGRLDPEELATLWGPQHLKLAAFVNEQGFTANFRELYEALVKGDDFASLPAEEKARREKLQRELAGGRPTLVETDTRGFTPGELAALPHLVEAGTLVEHLYQRELGVDAFSGQLPKDEPLSRAVLFRNQNARCATPQLEHDASCTAVPGAEAAWPGLYPASLKSDAKFCETLAHAKNAAALQDHFSVVRDALSTGKGFEAVPFSKAFGEDMEAVAQELDAAGAALTDESEAGFKAYLEAAAKAFRTNDWEGANAAWLAMGSSATKWYLRIAPDEVYGEPCAVKALFAMNLSRLNPDSRAWREKLEPVKHELEQTLAGLAGAPYKARDVKFKLPDFIDVVLNTGDQRNPHGATVGQSLPNWGKVAEKGGRTVVMTNLYTDPDSQAMLRGQMASLFCQATFAQASTDAKAATLSVVLHEASHNLGPSHDYQVKGKVDDVVFGGPLAATMEELKAQTSALFFSEWLVEHQLLSAEEARTTHVRDVAWAFGHIARGMYAGDGKPKNYSQLAAMQLGTLAQAQALVWKADEKAANGTDTGCFELDFSKWKDTIVALEKRVLKIKAQGDRSDAEALKATFVDAQDDWGTRRALISERWLRAPKATFVYAIHD
jgi:hypothetical protein